MKKVFDVIESSAYFLSNVFKSSIPTMFDIETADDEHTLVCSDGSFLTCFSLKGVAITIGAEEFETLMGVLDRALEPALIKPGHKIQFVFASNPVNTKETLEETLMASRSTCKNLSIDLSDVLDSRVNHVSKLISNEEVHIAIWTSPSVLFKTEKERALSNKKETGKKLPAIPVSGQNLIAAIPEIRDRHQALVTTFLESLSDSAFFMEKLTAHEALRVARKALYQNSTAPDWKPCLPGDPIPRIIRDETKRELDFSDIQYPPLSWQMFPSDMERFDRRYVSVDGYDYAPLSIEIPPQEITDFNTLYKKLQSLKIPFRMSFLIEGGGIGYTHMKGIIAPFLTWAPPYNKKINEAVQRMKAFSINNAAVGLKISLCTWTKSGKKEQLFSNASKLSNTVSSWGNCEVREIPGDEANLLINTCPFLSSHSISNPSVGPLNEVIRMLPLMRPASPWDSAGFFYRTDDGKAMPFQPGSSLQATWNYIIFAPPGYGKSVQTMTVLQASVMQPGLTRLPRIAYVDIGHSGEAFINMLKEALPENMRHYVMHARMRMSRDYAINVFDTQLGARYPTSEHRAFLVNFITKIVTPPERPQGYDSMSQMVSKIIDELYKKFSDEKGGTPKPYSEGLCPEVDALIKSYGFDVTQACWWEIVDFLFMKGHVHEATLAQRYAVPVLADAPGPSREAAIEDLYGGDMKIATGEPLNKAFARLVSDAVRDIPIVADVTQFDLGDARIAAIDIDEVAKQGGAAADHITAIVYMLSRFALTKNFRLDLTCVKEFPEQYQDYHRARINDIKEDMKWVVCDEFHRTFKSPQVQDDVLVDMREGRKFKIGVILASQSIDDFPDHLVEFSTGVFIHNAGNDKNSYRLMKLFGFNETARQLLVEKVMGPTEAGAPFLGFFKMKKKIFCQYLISSISPVEKWATSSTTEDVQIRRALYSRLGAHKARNLLAEMYPSGSADKEIERLRLRFASEGKKVDVVHYVIDQAIEIYNKKKIIN